MLRDRLLFLLFFLLYTFLSYHFYVAFLERYLVAYELILLFIVPPLLMPVLIVLATVTKNDFLGK